MEMCHEILFTLTRRKAQPMKQALARTSTSSSKAVGVPLSNLILRNDGGRVFESRAASKPPSYITLWDTTLEIILRFLWT
ncbi:hypothetical protein SAMN04488498_1831 [Mesorhizobium albiziae]|uniref:Uncharacterized protein n=1 Tax=Neomesorhizobium albiziae TaxID=335020 RepID=A0A1I4G3V3_9HYPH|nr:hypothetical protein SAMN04488498_1831 [Mesorhizobium albiziae]